MAEEAKRPTVMVGCTIPGGVRLHVMERRDRPVAALADAGAPALAMFRDKGWIDLPGFAGTQKQESFTAVDKADFDLWMAENVDSPLVTSGSIFVQDLTPPVADAPVEEKPKKAEEPKKAQ